MLFIHKCSCRIRIRICLNKIMNSEHKLAFKKIPASLTTFALVALHVYLGGFAYFHILIIIFIFAMETLHLRTRTLIHIIFPLLLYGIFYDMARYVPVEWRPDVNVSILFDIDNWLFNGQPYQWFSSYHSTIKDILAAIPYNLHFYMPFIYVTAMWRMNRGALSLFCWSFFLMNMAALITQIIFPTAPPWYHELHGFLPADYSMHGYAAGLLRIDELFSMNYFSSMYAQGSIVFGAFPSMHAAWPVLMALWSQNTSKTFSLFYVVFAIWMWWAAIYLHHHYVVDVLFGIIYAVISYRILCWLEFPKEKNNRKSTLNVNM